MKANVETAPSLIVTVANSQKVLSKLKCPEFAWTMQGQPFKKDLRVIRLESSSMVLGIDWLRSYGRIMFDFQQNSVTLCKDGTELSLKGIDERAKLKMITAAQCYQDIIRGACCLISQCEPTTVAGAAAVPQPILQVIEQYLDVFQEPQELPPQRSQDHKIPLVPGAKPVNIRPYRHSHEQKGEIERQVKEMLGNSIIQGSNSPYASPVLLVKKKKMGAGECV